METMCESCKDLQIEINNAQKEMNECPCDSPIRALKPVSDGMQITIDKGVPLPEPKLKPIEIVRQMEVGDSILFPVPNHGHLSHYKKEMKRLGWEFQSRKDTGGFRVWRTA